MTATMDNIDFWLPSEFLTDDDILMVKGNLNKNAINTAFTSSLAFPIEFGSYDSSALSSPIESLEGSTKTESDEDDLLACLTRQLACSSLKENAQKNLEKSWVMSISPQSTLSSVGSWSGHSALSSPSPPAMPFGGINDGWDLICAAAGQVARLKISGEGSPHGRGFLAPPQILSSIQHPSSLPVSNHNPNTGFYGNHPFSQNLSQGDQFGKAKPDQMMKQHRSSIWGNQIQLRQQGFDSNGRYERKLGFAESACPPSQVQCPNPQNHPPQHCAPAMRAVFLGGSGVKRECTGTGVFLPRRYGSNNRSECRKKPGCSTALLPARVVQTLNSNFYNMASHSQAQSGFNHAFIPEYDKLMSRRNANAMSNQQQVWNRRPEGRMSHELCLPQEWTY